MIELPLIFVAGILGTAHCLGMCGPFAVTLGAAASTWSVALKRQLAYSAGRVFTYGFLGALSAGMAHLAGFNQIFSGLRGGFTVGGGILMVLLGLILLKIVPLRLPSFGNGTVIGRLFSHLFQSRGLGSKWLLGLATGFLPCMLSWAMIVKAATAPDPLRGFLTMVFFGLGTAPVLFSTGFSASLLSFRMRLFGERAAALSVIAMGFILLFKGTRYLA
jgi:sulfite exporter TauE/SafE